MAFDARNTTEQLLLEEKVKEYAKELFGDDVIKEYNYVIGEWRKYINQVIDAERLAIKNHEEVLNKILNEQQKADQLSALFGMMALSLVAGPALSWIVGTVEARVFPRLFAATQNRATQAVLQFKNSTRPVPVTMHSDVKQHNVVAAKVFGEFTGNLAQRIYIDPLNFLIAQLPERKSGAVSYQELSAFGAEIAANAKSDEVHKSLKTRVENALTDEITRTQKAINDLALFIYRSTDFAPTFLKILYRNKPEVQQMDLRNKMRAVEHAVEKTVDFHRGLWAHYWLYYGKVPPSTSVDEMARKIERQIWSLWIVDQEFKFTSEVPRQMGAAGMAGDYRKKTKVEGRGGVKFHQLIVDRLIELGVVLPQSVMEAIDLHIRNKTLLDKENPTVSIDGTVDNEKELTDIQTWARNLRPELISGRFEGVSRTIGSIGDVHKK